MLARLLPPAAEAAAPRGSSITYSPEQLRIIAHGGSHLQVIASAGAGKTEVLAQRIAMLLDAGVAPRAIIAFTFTNDSAERLNAPARLEAETERVVARLWRRDRLRRRRATDLRSEVNRILHEEA